MELRAIRERAERYCKNPTLSRLGEAENHYAADVPRLLQEIEQLKEQLKDRENDLEFEYNSRIEAEQQLDDLKDQLHTCQSELRYEQLQRNAAEAR